MSRTIEVWYPTVDGRIELRTEQDWTAPQAPVRVLGDGACHVFELEVDRPTLHFKPILVQGDEIAWARGENSSVEAEGDLPGRVWPHFDPDAACSVCTLHSLDDELRGHRFRVFLPPGYAENTLRRYPVLYMHDGQNVFFPDEAFSGAAWRIPETLEVLGSMNLVDPMIVVGIYPNDRTTEYSRPGWEPYADFLVQELIPRVDELYRTVPGPQTTAIMGSSLGGVAAFYLAWEWPGVFGMAACLSSTFGLRDNLFERVATEPPRDARLYLDSGWPHDNFEATRTMYHLLRTRGYRDQDLCYFAFPEGRHNEASWATRAHLPLQFFFRDNPHLGQIPEGFS